MEFVLPPHLHLLASGAFPLDRQVWEWEQNALEADKRWPQTVSLPAWSTGAGSGCSYRQTAENRGPQAGTLVRLLFKRILLP